MAQDELGQTWRLRQEVASFIPPVPFNAYKKKSSFSIPTCSKNIYLIDSPLFGANHHFRGAIFQHEKGLWVANEPLPPVCNSVLSRFTSWQALLEEKKGLWLLCIAQGIL